MDATEEVVLVNRSMQKLSGTMHVQLLIEQSAQQLGGMMQVQQLLAAAMGWAM